jgi:hypothetical protein
MDSTNGWTVQVIQMMYSWCNNNETRSPAMTIHVLENVHADEQLKFGQPTKFAMHFE